ncbi:MAG: hypothetical protein HY020_02010 [Burkholderiales bacterium]|nr:hypothetical protein [Burkholderiales bacterium]
MQHATAGAAEMPVVACQAVILGAGLPARGETPSPLFSVNGQGRLLDWLVNALGGTGASVSFVGGYRFEEIAALYPSLDAVLNPAWRHTGAVGSLLKARLKPGQTCLVSYADILYREGLVGVLCADVADVTLAVDTHWRQRYEARSVSDLAHAEVVQLEGMQVRGVHDARSAGRPAQPDAEFVGLARLGPQALSLLADWATRPELLRWSMPRLLHAFVEAGLTVRAADCAGDWAELNAPQDAAHFVLGTKAQTLARLEPMVRHSRIGAQTVVTMGDWRQDRDDCLRRVAQMFGAARLAVRSSAREEDGFATSGAGQFESVLDVDGGNPAAVATAIERVAASYPVHSDGQQVLVQRMVDGVAFSGVAMTRTLSYGAPYRVINYDSSTGSTDGVTSGRAGNLRTLYMHRDVDTLPPSAPAAIASVLTALREIEELVGHDSLDIEFAVSPSGEVHVFQARPIAVDHARWAGSDERIALSLRAAAADFQRLQCPGPFTQGRRTVFSVMTDWNPAEMIGTRPRRLAYSLYAELITDEVWARQRAEYGYRAVAPQSLMHEFAGHAYIDVRASLNSFCPAVLDDALARKLVEHGIERLRTSPQLHDKVEFEVAFTCLAFDFEHRAAGLLAAGFDSDEVGRLRDALTTLTQQALQRIDTDRACVDSFSARQQAMLAREDLAPLSQALYLLDDCRAHGTLAFAHLARAGFVAMSFLNSAVAQGLLSDAERAALLQSFSTVASAYRHDVERLQRGEVGLAEFLMLYGHLRPGTYDITVPSYAEEPLRYLDAPPHMPMAAGDVVEPEPVRSELCAATRVRLSEALAGLGLRVDITAFEHFVEAAIVGRELGKFVFTRSLSKALDQLARFGQDVGLSREELSHLSLDDLRAFERGQFGADGLDQLRWRLEENRLRHELALGIELPAVLMDATDCWTHIVDAAQPNYVGTGVVVAEVCSIGAEAVDHQQLQGCIALVPQADPGFDWLFSHGIAGLVTAYGGANSHMAIRAAEFGLPAAIGVGEERYRRLCTARRLRLDCRQRTLEVAA